MPKQVTPIGRLSFPSLFKPTAFENQEPKYSTVLLMDPESPELTAMKQAATKAARDKWGDKLPSNLRSPFRNGDEKPDLDGYDGKIYVRFSSKTPPIVVDWARRPIDATSVDDNRKLIVYPGVRAIVSWTVYAYDKSGNKGIAFGLGNVQIVGGGASFSSRSNPDDDFAIFDAPVDLVAGAGDMFD